jgi:hypothetical protein
MQKGAVMVYFEVLSWDLPRGTEENQKKNHTQASQLGLKLGTSQIQVRRGE